MLGQDWYYYRTMRKVISAVGVLFNDIQMVKMDYTTNTELSRITVPLSYEGKETFMTRLFADPDATRGTQVNLPAMTYEFMGLSYAPSRKQSPNQKNLFTQEGNVAKRYALAIPFDMKFELNIWGRNLEDAFQIVEQIIPLVVPSYTLKLKYLVDGNNYVSENMPITFDSIDFKNDYEGTSGKVREVTFTLGFTVQTFFYGPQPSEKLIKEVIITLNNGLLGNGGDVATIDSRVVPRRANISDPHTIATTITEP